MMMNIISQKEQLISGIIIILNMKVMMIGIKAYYYKNILTKLNLT